jgi:hypothetical protein
MILSPDGSPLQHHFIRPEFLIALLEKRAFHLIRQDQQKSDRNDGVLPRACFENPFIGPLERSLGIAKDFAIGQAHAITSLRPQTYIMSWTRELSEGNHQRYGEDGKRCRLQVSKLKLSSMIGYIQGFPPKQEVHEVRGVRAHAQLKEPLYTDGTKPIPVFPPYYATVHKNAALFEQEAELRIEAVPEIDRLDPETMPPLILWNIHRFTGLSVTFAPRITVQERERILALCTELSIPVFSQGTY